MGKRKDKKTEIKGALRFESVDQRVAQFKYVDDGEIVGSHAVDLPASVIPEDFDPAHDEVSGEYVLTVNVKRNPFPKRGE